MVPIKVVNRLATVTVTVNGKGNFRFLVDTGSESSMIDIGLARKLGLTPTHRIELATLAGVRLQPVSPAAIDIGPIEIDTVDLIWMEDFVGKQTHLDGVIGQDVLSRFNYLLDYERRSLTFGQPDMRGTSIPCTKGKSRCEISVPVAVHGRFTSGEASLMLDSGADSLTLLNEKAREFETLLERDALYDARMLTHTGLTGGVLTGIVPRLLVAGRTLLQATVVLVKGKAAEHEGDGLLPTSLFRSVYFNNAQGSVILNPDKYH